MILRKTSFSKIRLIAISLLAASSIFAGDNVVNPNSVGLSSDRLEAIDGIIEDAIDSGNIPMGAALVARKGKIAYLKFFGKANVETQQNLQENAIFRIASMTKLVTNVAAMICYENGKFNMNDPISLYIPAFTNSTVAVESGNSFTTRPPTRPITVRDVMTHRAGMIYQPFFVGPLSDYYLSQGVAEIFPYRRAETLESYINRYASTPMYADPGGPITYGVATDVLGRLVEVWSGQTLADFIQDKILDPLDMEDTSFFIPPGSPKAARLTSIYTTVPLGSNNGTFEQRTTEEVGSETGGPQMLYCGAAGLLSTPKDYFHFAQMILDKGTYKNITIISRKSIEMMSVNQLGDEEFPDFLKQLGDKTGFGMGVRTERGVYDGLESLGTLSFAGIYWTRYWIDPHEELIVLAFTQSYNLTWDGFADKVKNAAYQAIKD